MGIDIREFSIPFGNIFYQWNDARGQRLYEYTAAYKARFDDHNLDEEDSVHRFRFMMCMMDSVLQYHSRRRLSHELDPLSSIATRPGC